MSVRESEGQMQDSLSLGAVVGYRRSESGSTLDFDCATGQTVRLDVCTPDMVRVRVAPGGEFAESLTVRWGYVRDDWEPVPVTVEENAGAITLHTAAWTLRVNRDPLQLTFLDCAGQVMARETAPAALSPDGGGALSLEMAPDEHFYGFGFQRLGLDARGNRLEWTRKFRNREATVPLFLSTRGYGFYSNNTWKHAFDFTGQADADAYTITTTGGQLDYFLMAGPSFRQILRCYTDLTGRSMLAPRWALGLLYICRYFETQQGVLDIARQFRQRDIPCDMIGLEPGWEDVPYQMAWRWSPERFPDPAGMVRALAEQGFALEMWESGDAPKSGYADPDVRREWFRQRIPASLDIGAKFFKQDDPYPRGITSEELQQPELGAPLEGSGELAAEEMVSWTNTLYTETLVEEYRRHTGERAFVIFNSYNATIASHRWPTAWAGDFAAAAGLLSAGLSGHGMASLDMRNDTPAGIHYGFLTPFSIVDAWAYYKEPWLYPEHLEECHRFYSKLRHRLAPYLYTALHQAHASGVPMMRAMVLEYPQDPQVQGLTSQHLLGDWLLVGMGPRVYLPAGTWVDYWTGREYRSAGEWVECPFDEPAGGPLLVRAGAILPMQPVSAYLEQEPADLILLDIYPAPERSRYTLYEDDGRTYAYESGACATTAMVCQRTGDSVRVEIGPRTGDYQGKPAGRTYLLSVHTGVCPAEVRLADTPLLQRETRAALLHDADDAGWWFDAERGIAWIKPDDGWLFDYDGRGPQGDPERDTLRWTTATPPTGAGYALSVCLPAGERPTAPTPRAAQPSGLIPDRLTVVANPPERIALRHAGWLPMKTNLYVTVKSGEQTVPEATNVVRLEVWDADGHLLHTDERQAERGRAAFLGVEYKPEEYTFRLSSPGLQSCEVCIRQTPPVPGRM